LIQIQQARLSWQLLVYNTSTLNLTRGNIIFDGNDSQRDDPPDDLITEDRSIATTTLTKIQAHCDALKQTPNCVQNIYTEEVTNALKSIKELILANRDKNSVENKSAQMEAISQRESLIVENGKLIQDMAEEMSNLKGKNSAEKACIAVQLEHSNLNVDWLEKTRIMLAEQVDLLNKGYLERLQRIQMLEGELEGSEKQLIDLQKK
jgi:hypothetical protein